MSETEAAGALRTLIVDDEPLAVERMQVICAKLKDFVLILFIPNGGCDIFRFLINL